MESQSKIVNPGQRVEKKPSLWRKRLLKESDGTELIVPAIDKLTLLAADDKVFESEDIIDIDDDLNVISSPYSHDSVTENVNKYDTDSNFSDFYLGIVRTLRTENKSSSQITFVSLKNIDAELELKREFYPKPLPGKICRNLKRKLEKYDVDRNILEIKTLIKPEHGSRKPRQDKGNLNSMSSLWQMLATYDEFTVTKPDFNIYDAKCHWLDQKPLPWIIQESSRKKCALWLRKNFE